MKLVQTNDVRAWLEQAGSLTDYYRSIGQRYVDADYIETQLGLPLHVRFAIEKLAEAEGEPVPGDALDSIPFYSLCKGLFLPLSFMQPERAAQIFGLKTPAPPDAAQREALLKDLLDKEIGLSLIEKLGCILGDPFLGRRSTFRRDSLLRLLLSVRMCTRSELLDRLAVVGDVAIVFAESQTRLRNEENPLTAAEVIRTLRFIPDERRAVRFDILRSILHRCGKLEAYYLAKLLLRKAGFGFDYQGQLISKLLAEKFGAAEEHVHHATALTDVFTVAEVLEGDGPDGLKQIQLQPLVAVKPMLAGGTTDEIERYPMWVERKYDGIRFMLHKSTDAGGSVLCGAYTRTRNDWLELAPGLEQTIRMLPARNCIVDGELFGTVLDLDGARPASVYEVYAALQGEPTTPVNMKFAAFDLIYVNGQDLTNQPLTQRRQMLQGLVAPLQPQQAGMQMTPVPVSVAEGQLAQNKDDVNRLYQHFRAQGYEGVIAKDPNAPYRLATRDKGWLKRKPVITLDLVLLGAVLAVTTKEHAGAFGSYIIGARNADGGFDDLGDVAGVDRQRDAQLQAEIMREGLLTGERVERPSGSGVRPGMMLRPHIVVTVKFEGITRDGATGDLKLRDPKLVTIRSDKSAHEADTVDAIREIYLRQRVG